MMSPNLLKTLIRHEGMRLKPYKDTTGHTTIGVGRNLDANGITEKEALYLLKGDVWQIIAEVAQAFTWFYDLNLARKEALINMAFNLGLPRLKTFKRMICAMEGQDYETAAYEMLDSKWASQVGDRAAELAEIIRSGEIHEDTGV